MSNALTTVSDVQRFASACVRYANETSDLTFRIEFHKDDPHNALLKQMGHPDAEDEGPKFYTYRDGDTVVIHVPNPTTATSERDAKVIKAGILHEILHTSEGTSDGRQEILDSGIGKLGTGDPLAHIFNIVEDHRIERLDCEKFEGDAYVLRDAYEILSKEFADRIRSGEADLSGLEDTTIKVLGVRLMDHVARESWMHLGHVTEEQFDVNPGESVRIASELVDKGYDDRMRSVDTVAEAITLAKDLFNELFDEDADDHIAENAQEGEPGEGGQGDGDGEGEAQEGGAQEGAGESGEGEDGRGEGKQARGGDGEDGKPRDMPADDVDYLDFIRKRQRIPSSGTEPPSTGMHIDYSKYLQSADDFAAFDPCPIDEIGVANFGANFYKDGGNGAVPTEQIVRNPRTDHRGTRAITGVFDSHGLQVNSLANRIRRLLQVQSQARWVGGATSGRVHRKSAYRAALPTVGDGRWNREIFKRRHQDATLDVAVSVLCDFSGSMGGRKMAHASFGGFILADAVGRVLRVPIQVQTFSEKDQYTVICVLKNWAETINQEEYTRRAGRAVKTMEQNDDGSAILWTYEDLRRRPEKRKVMIVLSDGSPASSRPGDAMGYTRQVVSDIQEEGKVEMYGIGIMDRNVEHIYKDYETINEADEIEGAILNTVKRKLIV